MHLGLDFRAGTFEFDVIFERCRQQTKIFHWNYWKTTTKALYNSFTIFRSKVSNFQPFSWNIGSDSGNSNRVANGLQTEKAEIADDDAARTLLMVCLHLANVRVGTFLTDWAISHARSCDHRTEWRISNNSSQLIARN